MPFGQPVLDTARERQRQTDRQTDSAGRQAESVCVLSERARERGGEREREREVGGGLSLIHI